ncbi:unnamed protein product [Ectocarpus fasciculatus]
MAHNSSQQQQRQSPTAMTTQACDNSNDTNNSHTGSSNGSNNKYAMTSLTSTETRHHHPATNHWRRWRSFDRGTTWSTTSWTLAAAGTPSRPRKSRGSTSPDRSAAPPATREGIVAGATPIRMLPEVPSSPSVATRATSWRW